eukprot:scaffold87693_cov17-Tisochrysis_lutea.AAC.1
MQQLDGRKKAQQAAQDGQLDRARASAPAPAAPTKKQKTLADCARNPADVGTEGLSGPPQQFYRRILPRTPNSQCSVHSLKAIFNVL